MRRRLTVILLTLTLVFILCDHARAGYSIVINKSNNILSLYLDGKLQQNLPVATGRTPSLTPEGNFSIACKLVNPYYSKAQIPGGSPRNPLGSRWLGLNIGGGGSYGIHGTNNPASIGTYASGGCIRMYNRDVIWLFDRIPVGTPVTITRRPAAPTPARSPPRPLKLLINGKELPLSSGQHPYIRGETVFIPLRPAIKGLGWEMIWHREYAVAELTKLTRKVYLDPGGNTVLLAGKFYRVPPGSVVKNDNIFIPLEFFHILPGVTHRWEEKSREVNLVE